MKGSLLDRRRPANEPLWISLTRSELAVNCFRSIGAPESAGAFQAESMVWRATQGTGYGPGGRVQGLGNMFERKISTKIVSSTRTTAVPGVILRQHRPETAPSFALVFGPLNLRTISTVDNV